MRVMSGRGAGHLALGVPAGAGGLDQTDSKGPCHPQPVCDSVITLPDFLSGMKALLVAVIKKTYCSMLPTTWERVRMFFPVNLSLV